MKIIYKILLAIGIILLLAILLCYFFGPEKEETSVVPENPTEEKVEQTIKLFYYDPALDIDSSGNILCSEKGLVAVERNISLTQTPIQDTLKLLLKGEITEKEKALGIESEYPLSGLALKEASLNAGVLTLGFEDPENKTSGGSCRAGILWAQIEATAKQFSGVTEVRFEPEELFQP